MLRVFGLLAAVVSVVMLAGCTASSIDEVVELDVPDVTISDLQITPGQAVLNTWEIDGQDVQFSLFVPGSHVPGEAAPLLLALPPGGQDLELVERTMTNVYRAEAERRGWVVVSPVAPDGVRFFDGAERYLAPLMDRVEQVFPPEGGRAHLAGMSNGGISAFRIGALHPDRWASLTAFPGFPRSSADRDGLADLVEADVAITMFVGETDTPWVVAAEDTHAALVDLGADVTYEVLPGAGHLLTSLWEGPRLWDTFAAARMASSG